MKIHLVMVRLRIGFIEFVNMESLGSMSCPFHLSRNNVMFHQIYYIIAVFHSEVELFTSLHYKYRLVLTTL